MTTQEEFASLARGIRQNDKKSLERLFMKLYVRLRNYANTLTNSPEDSEDIVQEVFATIWNRRSELDENKSIQTYLFVCTRNGCLNWLKHRKTEDAYARIMALVYEDGAGIVTPHESLVADDMEKDFRQVLDELPLQCRRVFELNRFEGLKYHEIAARLNISIKTVETQMSRALAKMRFQLKKHLAALP